MKQAKNVYISVDIEGMEGVVSRNQANRGKEDYGLARRRLTYDVNEAIRAAVDCGAENIVVSEGHGDLENLLIDELNPAADIISGAMCHSLQMQGINEGFDAMIIFGHAGGGMTLGGVLDHTYNGRSVHGMRINGVNVNTEAVCNSVIAGYYGVPLAAIIGDRAVVDEVHAYLPGCEGIVVKEGITRLSAKSISPVRARKLIYAGVRKALSELDNKELLVLAEPMTLEIDFNCSQTADVAELVPGVERLSPRSISYTGKAEDVFRLQTLLIACIMDEYPF